MMSFSPDVLGAYSADCGEGPSWDSAANALAWVDITGREFHLTEADGTAARSIGVDLDLGAALPIDGRMWLAAAGQAIWLLDIDGSMRELARLPVGTDIRFNDAKCDPDGRVLAGTMPYDLRPGVGGLYRLDGSRLTPLIENVALSNGLGWSPDGQTMYHIDSGPGTITAWSYQDGVPRDPRVLIEIQGEGILPDGMTVDDDGCLWIAVWGTGQVRRYSPEGRQLAVVDLPARQITSCAFGGAARDALFITSARYQLSAEQLAAEPHSGSLFVVDVGVTGPGPVVWDPTAAV